MRKVLTACALVCALAAPGFAAQLPNYAGLWVLDKEKSDELPPAIAAAGNMEMTVIQEKEKLTVVTGSEGKGLAYNLDGSKSKAQVGGRMPGEATIYLEKKDDGKLVLHVERELNIQGNAISIKVRETWEQADGGKTLKVKRTIESPRGTQDINLVFNKKG